jgi:hypothetical protein
MTSPKPTAEGLKDRWIVFPAKMPTRIHRSIRPHDPPTLFHSPADYAAIGMDFQTVGGRGCSYILPVSIQRQSVWEIACEFFHG